MHSGNDTGLVGVIFIIISFISVMSYIVFTKYIYVRKRTIDDSHSLNSVIIHSGKSQYTDCEYK